GSWWLPLTGLRLSTPSWCRQTPCSTSLSGDRVACTRQNWRRRNAAPVLLQSGPLAKGPEKDGLPPHGALLGHEQRRDDIDPQGQTPNENEGRSNQPDYSGVHAQIAGDAAAYAAQNGVR